MSRYAVARVVFAAVALVDAAAFVIPQAVLVPELWRETAELEGRQRAAQLMPEGVTGPAAHETRHREARSQLNPRDLLPTVSALARQAGMLIVTVKQSAADKDRAARRIHLQARGPFDRAVAFIDAVAVAIPFGQVEDMTLRHLPISSQPHAGIELEYVLSLPPIDSQKATSRQSVESETR